MRMRILMQAPRKELSTPDKVTSLERTPIFIGYDASKLIGYVENIQKEPTTGGFVGEATIFEEISPILFEYFTRGQFSLGCSIRDSHRNGDITFIHDLLIECVSLDYP